MRDHTFSLIVKWKGWDSSGLITTRWAINEIHYNGFNPPFECNFLTRMTQRLIYSLATA